ncbi:MAG: hypothetical protein RBT05_03215 [Bacteroidales bacterium]|jgi:hypothetical protein|nr:hypothetical protein [Bacteroidales bacterium]
MNIYLVLALIGFILVFKKLFSILGEKTLENIPPISNENLPKNNHETDNQDFFERFETIKKVNSKEKTHSNNTSYTPNTNQTNIDKHKQIEIKEENEFDLRKAVIYSEILNNPFLTK